MIPSNMRIPRMLLQHPDTFGGRRDDAFQQGEPIVREGRLVGLEPSDEAMGPILIPSLTEVHCHLDKCHTAHRLPGIGGDLSAAIAAQYQDKTGWTDADLTDRATRGLAEYAASATGLIRTHVDWGDTPAPPPAWSILRDLPGPARQCAALTGADQLAEPGFAAQVARAIAPENGVMGAFVLHHARRAEAIVAAFTAAETYGLALDFHVDEGLDPDLDNVEAIADLALATGFQGPILLGHTCALATLPNSKFDRIADKLAAAGISVAMLPGTNLYLQGRGSGTPTARGVTRLKELHHRGVNVTVGADNVRDAFCPVGRHDPRFSLELASLAGHLDPPFGTWLPLITTNARKALGADPLRVDGASVADLFLAEAQDLSDLIAGAPLTPLKDLIP